MTGRRRVDTLSDRRRPPAAVSPLLRSLARRITGRQRAFADIPQKVVDPVSLETIVFVVVIVLIVLFVLGLIGRGRMRG
jgi:hypothetical protein